ncbi:hypothetical protein FKG94_11710 [Exilibacterium tricleocarpae]|uniref:Lipoprotein n=1 Tax=Exilibacterium tricleocarpae TaxID=2591008 RepID=A0A545TN82_9GAMM|nr:hypothetical protein [Exilibacterium tricleocarpae]TQV78689.1 hypothetical protein FKG94_11710 [Exilibacterium tricleocarpae]
MGTITPRSLRCGRLAALALCFTVFGLAGCGKKQYPDPTVLQAEVFLKENKEGLLAPATLDGEFWPVCPPQNCSIQVDAPEVPDRKLFDLVLIEKKSPKPKQKQAGSQPLAGLVGSAHASGDGCTVWWVHYPNLGWVPYYDPNDPDCPP